MLMRTVLIPADGSENTKVAVRSVIAQARREPVGIHLLNVQVPLPSYVTRFFSGPMIRNYQREDGERQLVPSRQLLDAAGLTYVAHIQVGDVVPTITRLAADLRADEIIIGTNGGWLNTALQWLRAAQVQSRAGVPVIVVMPPPPLAHGAPFGRFGSTYPH
jgi:nucleotide-binding universal stress UspA family protein